MQIRPFLCGFLLLPAVLIFTPAADPQAAAPQAAAPPVTKTPAPPPSPDQQKAEQDRQRMMDLLHIPSIRHGADGDAKSPYAANYDESKAGYPPLPDPLVLKNGQPVTKAEIWWKQRRPEIVAAFDDEIYGHAPTHLPTVKWTVASTTRESQGDVPVITKQLVGHVDNATDPAIEVSIPLTLTTPANAKARVPVILALEFDPEVMAALAKRFPNFKPPVETGPNWKQQLLAKGWGYAIFIPSKVQADNGAGLNEGIIGLANHGQPRGPGDWGTLRAWAWVAGRCLDYFETDPAVDPHRVGITGHSRYGKAALVTMAYDSRFAIAYISSSGEGGAKILRRNWGELVENLAAPNEYHWMAGNFLKYAGPLHPTDLPVDAHELIALCAPRPVFIGGGATDGDGWADAKGMFLAAEGAGPVYRLLGKKDLGTTEFPPIETALIDGDIAFRQHAGGHTPGPNWPTFISFASRYLDK